MAERMNAFGKAGPTTDQHRKNLLARVESEGSRGSEALNGPSDSMTANAAQRSTWVIGSGSSIDFTGRQKITSADDASIHIAEELAAVSTTNGTVDTKEVVDLEE